MRNLSLLVALVSGLVIGSSASAQDKALKVVKVGKVQFRVKGSKFILTGNLGASTTLKTATEAADGAITLTGETGALSSGIAVKASEEQVEGFYQTKGKEEEAATVTTDDKDASLVNVLYPLAVDQEAKATATVKVVVTPPAAK